jgi:ABC-type transport system substrate-binding protein
MGSRSIRFSVILLASLLVAGTLFLAACGGGTTTTSGKATGSTAATGPKYGGTLRMVAQSNGANIGWPATQAVGGALIQSYYETLIHQDSSGAPKPWLADKWTVSPDHKWVSFTIHQGIKFSDGSDLTADVVKWNLDQYKAKHPEWGSIVVTDPNTVQVNLKSWSSGTLGDFGDVGEPALYMVSEAAYKTHGQDWMTKNPVGTGPFILKSYQTDASATLVKNPTYWAKDSNGKQLPYLDGLQFTFTQDPGTILMKAQAKEIDMVITVSPGEQMADYANMGWTVLRSHESNEVWVPDSKHPTSPWSKLEVREAAEYAIDRATIAKQFGFGYMTVPDQVPPADTTAYQANYSLARNYDPAKAKQLLAQAGYPTGFKTTLIEWPGANKQIALVEAAYLKAVGIQVDIKYTDMGKWNSYTGPVGDYQNAIAEGPCVSQDPVGIGTVSFALLLYGNNMQQPADFLTAYGKANTAETVTPALVQAATDILTKDALVIPVWDLGGGRVQAKYVQTPQWKTRGLPTIIGLETAWMSN